VTPPVIHVQPAPEMPKFDFRPGAGGTACLSFEGYLAFEEADAKLYARLQYFKTLLLLQGAIFDPPQAAEDLTPPYIYQQQRPAPAQAVP
jgi:hypothetical protein